MSAPPCWSTLLPVRVEPETVTSEDVILTTAAVPAAVFPAHGAAIVCPGLKGEPFIVPCPFKGHSEGACQQESQVDPLTTPSSAARA